VRCDKGILDVTFYIPDEPNLAELLHIDPDRDWQLMRRRQRWLLQTYLRLLHAGHPVKASGSLPSSGIIVFHAMHKRYVHRLLDPASPVVLLGIRGDKRQILHADYELVQNGRWADDRQRFFIPYWPQPGLIPRETSRGTRVTRISYKGFDLNLHEYFRSNGWTRWLIDQGVTWDCSSMSHDLSEQHGVNVNWHDYSNVDVAIALRPKPIRRHEKNGYTGKPATKLYNAWIASVPAILGPEYAYQEIRKSDLDYLEASDPESVKSAILRLKNNPRLYRAMVDNGRHRAAEYSQQKILEQWEALLFNKLPELVARRGKTAQIVPRSLRAGSRWLTRALAGRTAR
jgi:glycosyltransferase involved in cell wall biosynthesis